MEESCQLYAPADVPPGKETGWGGGGGRGGLDGLEAEKPLYTYADSNRGLSIP